MMSDKEKTVYICAEDKMIENNQIVDIQSRQSINSIISYKDTDDLFADVCKIIESAQKAVYSAVNTVLFQKLTEKYGRDMIAVIFIIIFDFTKHFLKLSTRHVDNQ